jgi:UDP-2,3-diacylglucosamine hydrolase
MTDEILFISDCHLDVDRPEIIRTFHQFIELRAAKARSLYILGDLFEVWLGDDDSNAHISSVADALKTLSLTTDVFFMAGNRDFLLGEKFATRAGFKIVTEPLTIELDGQQVLLIHGDTLCTDDHDYQAFRKLVRESAWQNTFLSKTLEERHQIAAQLRRDSVTAMTHKSIDIMDVNLQTVSDCFKQQAVDIIIHGHTHRPAVHHHSSDHTRYVLGDWHSDPSYLSWQPDEGFNLVDFRVNAGASPRS